MAKLALLCVLLGCAARASPKSAQNAASSDRATLLAAARDAIAADDLAAAGTIYEQLLRIDPADDEARAGMARLDAWGGRLPAAERALRDVLARHPDDEELRALLVDVLTWRRRWQEAAVEIRDGLARRPSSAVLLERSARLSFFRGDASEARALILRAQERAPESPSIQALSYRIFRGEVRAVARSDLYPTGHDDLHATELTVTQWWRRVQLTARTEQSQRFASSAPLGGYNGFYAISAGFPLGIGYRAALEVGAGGPAHSIPRWLVRGSIEAALGARWSVDISAAFSEYPDGTSLKVANPTLRFIPRDDLRCDLRYWLARVNTAAGVPSDTHSAGAQVTSRVAPRLELGGGYFYGVQLDRNRPEDLVASVRSHALAVHGDWRWSRTFGTRPEARLERRITAGGVLWIPSVALEGYVRW
ncbi:MAG: tetratricopeptide repeat protein [Deltaproteobacteria bacterium]|nr:tetratricopeptide repeat protein [Deltaproteobacteria bacterium]